MKIIAFSFGCGRMDVENKESITAKDDWRERIADLSSKVNPGKSNFAIADKVARVNHAKEFYIQWEVLIALYIKHRDWLRAHSGHIHVIWPKERGYINSHEILTEIKQLNPCVLVLHPAMKNRVSAIYKKIVGNSPIILFSDPVYDFCSIQWWTKCSLFWLIYDSLAMIHHRLKGWI